VNTQALGQFATARLPEPRQQNENPELGKRHLLDGLAGGDRCSSPAVTWSRRPAVRTICSDVLGGSPLM
jgi:hypothetical protein